MMLIFFVLVAVFQPSFACSKCSNRSARESYAGGETNASIEWHNKPFRNCTNRNMSLSNEEMNYRGDALELSSIPKQQLGRYNCILIKPIIIETLRVDRSENKTLELRCDVAANPPPETVWMKNNKTLFQNEQYEMITDYDCDYVYNSTLIISTKLDYSGIYTCQVTNKIGHSVMAFNVTAPALKGDVASDYGDRTKP